VGNAEKLAIVSETSAVFAHEQALDIAGENLKTQKQAYLLGIEIATLTGQSEPAIG
jgi:hypothetical protein